MSLSVGLWPLILLQRTPSSDWHFLANQIYEEPENTPVPKLAAMGSAFLMMN